MRFWTMLVVAGALCGAAEARDHAMVAAANPLATEAGLKILRAGGSAVDAAVAVQATLGLVEPQSTSLSGGAFMTYYDAKTRTVTAYDGREVAPAAATPNYFVRADGKPMSVVEIILSGRSAGVPGALAMLSTAHHDHGRLPWHALFDSSERLASDGFVVSPRMGRFISSPAPETAAPDVIAYFTNPDGSRMKAGDHLRNPAYAATLRRLAADGPDALLKGPIAADIVKRLNQEPTQGLMTLADLAAYKPIKTTALCRPYRQWLVCEPNAPSGGPVMLEGLGLLERSDIATRNARDPVGWLRLAEAERLAYADDLKYVADPAFVSVPVKGLLDPAYLDERAKLMGDRAGPPPTAGNPPGAPKPGADRTREPGGTSSFVIVDTHGNVVSMTTTVNYPYGDGRMVDGFFINNQLNDFSSVAVDKDGAAVANAVGPGKRPRSSMAPAIILDHDRRFVMAVGSPGGLAIPAYILKTMVGVLDWQMSMQDAIDLPNLIAIGPNFVGETGKFSPELLKSLADLGVPVKEGFGAEDSGLQGIIVRADHLEGGADPRREGVAKPCCRP
jgi:gamma-glutamyltranspeptidase/glutathione hydrolase